MKKNRRFVDSEFVKTCHEHVNILRRRPTSTGFKSGKVSSKPSLYYLSSNSVVAWNNINTPCCQKENFEVNGVGFQPKKEWQIYICGICGITTKEKDDEGNLASSFLETHTS